MRRTTLIGRVTAATAAAALMLAACTGGGTESQPEETGVTESEQVAEEPEAEATWQEVTAGNAALPENRVLSLSASLPGERGRPVLRGGSVAAAGKPARAAVWTLSPDGLGRPQRLDVEPNSAVTAFAADQETTLAAGGAWTDGERLPFLLRSSDRESWEPVELPEKMDERGLGVDEVALTGDGTPLLAAVDAENVPVVVDVEAGELIDLPVPDRVERIDDFTALLAAGDSTVALASARLPGGVRTVVSYHSDDDGRTWEEAGELAGEQTAVSGAVAVTGGVLATGHRVQRGEVAAAAWFSADAQTWEHEAVPAFPEHTSGWDTWLEAPTAKGPRAWVGYTDERRLHNLVLERNGQGRWRIRAQTRPWRTPGAELAVEVGGARANAAHVHTLRSWNGHVEAGYQPPGGEWGVSAEPPPASAPVGWWESVEQNGDALALVAARTEVRTQEQAWTRRTVLAPFTIADDTLRRGRWQPPRSRDFTNIARATDADGATVLLGDRFFPSDDPAENDEADLAGWIRPRPQGDWRPVRGVGGPRTEFLNGLEVHDGRWVAVGMDRAASEQTASYRGAVWTSENGRRWQRERGGFEVDDAHSQLHDSCTLPGGDLLVVGAAEDPQAGTSPLAFRHDGDGWSRATLGRLDPSASLRRCAVVEDTLLVQGRVGSEHVLWSAPVGEELEFIRVPVATGRDTLGELRRVEGGLAAPGSLQGGRSDEPVLWLSTDGVEWHPEPIPTDRPLDAEAVVEADGALTVALTGDSGPGAWTLENPDELLADLASQADTEQPEDTGETEEPTGDDPAVPGD